VNTREPVLRQEAIDVVWNALQCGGATDSHASDPVPHCHVHQEDLDFVDVDVLLIEESVSRN